MKAGVNKNERSCCSAHPGPDTATRKDPDEEDEDHDAKDDIHTAGTPVTLYRGTVGHDDYIPVDLVEIQERLPVQDTDEAEEEEDDRLGGYTDHE
jgi:hypothetical protein